ncbi:hypothetical protein DPMN_029409 [Dreissena polymorpha]|uniref:Uncharacterized protein n=1 Tax=Dreissena polymorpha TaxID=45954 RepID=A0A9D4LWE3_DREPO|nr:hypothetical protein DPMN_029409 [Dreissena polymorpha]
MPLALANLLGRTLKMYCSNRANPVYEIQPYLSTQEREERGAINLALFQIRGFEHFDACSNLEDSKHLQETPETSLQETSRVTPPSMSSSTLETLVRVQITPRKQACYISPIKINRKRKRVAEPAKWKKNMRKHRRVHGLDYASTAGKQVSGRKLKHGLCNCKCNCKDIFSLERNRIFQDNWSLGSYQRQKNFLCPNIMA